MGTLDVAPLRFNFLVFDILFDHLVIYGNSRSCSGRSFSSLLLKLPLLLVFSQLLIPLLLFKELLSYFRLFADFLHNLLLLIELLLIGFTYLTWTFWIFEWHGCYGFWRQRPFLNLFFFFKVNRLIYRAFQILKLVILIKLTRVDFIQILGLIVPLTFIDKLHCTWSHHLLLLFVLRLTLARSSRSLAPRIQSSRCLGQLLLVIIIILVVCAHLINYIKWIIIKTN